MADPDTAHYEFLLNQHLSVTDDEENEFDNSPKTPTQFQFFSSTRLDMTSVFKMLLRES